MRKSIEEILTHAPTSSPPSRRHRLRRRRRHCCPRRQFSRCVLYAVFVARHCSLDDLRVVWVVSPRTLFSHTKPFSPSGSLFVFSAPSAVSRNLSRLASLAPEPSTEKWTDAVDNPGPKKSNPPRLIDTARAARRRSWKHCSNTRTQIYIVLNNIIPMLVSETYSEDINVYNANLFIFFRETVA